MPPSDPIAKAAPEVLAALPVIDPALPGKSLTASKTPWGTLAVAGATWASAKYGFGWDDQTCAMIGGLGVLIGSYLMRKITSTPIKSIF